MRDVVDDVEHVTRVQSVRQRHISRVTDAEADVGEAELAPDGLRCLNALLVDVEAVDGQVWSRRREVEREEAEPAPDLEHIGSPGEELADLLEEASLDDAEARDTV